MSASTSATRPTATPHAIAYLDASNPRNVPLYERFGFAVAGEIRAGSSPVVVPTVRGAH